MRRRPVASPAVSAYLAGVRLLARRELTEAEVESRLTDRGYAGDEIRTAIEQLIHTGAIDDRRAAFAHARTASRLKARGRLRILRELEARGVARELARDAVAAIPADDDLSAIERFLARKGAGSDSSPADRRRLFQQLLRRGFDPDLIAKALKE
jgi:regulatory protein